jgi:hypothetical protein
VKPALAFLLLAACGSVVPSTAARLATLDPLAADPSEIAVAVILPPGLAVSPGSARLELGARLGAEQLVESFVLKDSPAETGPEAPEGASSRIFTVSDIDAKRLRKVQEGIAALKRKGDASGHLSIGLAGCAVGSGPSVDATGSVLIRLRDDGPFLPLIRDGSLADLLGAEVLRSIQPCHRAE